MKAKDDSIQLLQQQLDDLVVVRARGEIEQDKFLQRTIEIQQQMEALRQSKLKLLQRTTIPDAWIWKPLKQRCARQLKCMTVW